MLGRGRMTGEVGVQYGGTRISVSRLMGPEDRQGFVWFIRVWVMADLWILYGTWEDP